jgi:hypothetical protein
MFGINFQDNELWIFITTQAGVANKIYALKNFVHQFIDCKWSKLTMILWQSSHSVLGVDSGDEYWCLVSGLDTVDQ